MGPRVSNRPRARAGGLHRPSSSWPVLFTFAATPGSTDDAALQEAIQRTHEQLELHPQIRRAERRTEIRWVTVDADECGAVLADLGIADGDRAELRRYCTEHPGGRLVAASCAYEPARRRFTVLPG